MVLKNAAEQLEVFTRALARILAQNQYSIPTHFRPEKQPSAQHGPRRVEQPEWIIVPNTPLLLADLPNRTGAGKPNQHRLAISIDGSYTINQVGDEQSVVRYTANASIFKYPIEKPRTLKILEAWHYDFSPGEPDGNGSYDELGRITPHAMFHAQRGTSNDSLSKLRLLLDHGATNVKAMQSAQFPDDLEQEAASWATRLRVPTPRMDWFGVALVILADLVMDLNQDKHRDSFNSINASFKKSSPLNNLLRPNDGGCPKCFPRQHSCPSNWYRLT